MWNRFVKIVNGLVIAVVFSKAEELEGFVRADSPVRVGSEYDGDTDTFAVPNPDTRQLLKALVIIIKANADKITIPPAALTIWQRVKEDNL